MPVRDAIDTILIPVDGSPGSMKALHFGGMLAAQHGARVVLLHVFLRGDLTEALRGRDEIEREGGEGVKDLVGILDRATIEKLKAEGASHERLPQPVLDYIATRVTEAAERGIRSHGVSNVRTVIEDGEPAPRILELAEKENADAIVMGARGLSNVEALLLGSVSQEVTHAARCTCVVVR